MKLSGQKKCALDRLPLPQIDYDERVGIASTRSRLSRGFISTPAIHGIERPLVEARVVV